MNEIIFYCPRVKITNSLSFGFMYPFKIFLKGSGSSYDQEYYNEISVEISKTLLSIWDYENDYEIEKVLFQFALDRIKSIKISELIKTEVEIYLDLETQSKNKPYDPNKVPDPDGYKLILDSESTKPEIKFGF